MKIKFKVGQLVEFLHYPKDTKLAGVVLTATVLKISKGRGPSDILSVKTTAGDETTCWGHNAAEVGFYSNFFAKNPSLAVPVTA